MELLEAIKSRKSIRGYKPTPVSREVLAEILEIAIHAPSNTNTQPWEFTILGGKVLNNLKQALQEQFRAGVEPQPDFPFKALTGVYRKRQVELGISLYQLMGIAREDREKRDRWTLKMLRAFDAPNAIIIAMDEEISSTQDLQAMFSVGTVSQTIALAAVEFGLGTCIHQALINYPKVVRQIASIPDSKKLVIGIVVGYPDWDFAANKLQSTREPLDNIVTWQGM